MERLSSEKGIASAAITFFLFVAFALVFGVMYLKNSNALPIPNVSQPVTKPVNPSSAKPNTTPSVGSSQQKSDIVLLDVPFTSQSPFGEWKDPRQQDACEEASVLMAMHWVKSEPITSKEAAKQEILAISKYQETTYGAYQDTSLQDTAKRILEGYYHHTNYEIKSVTSADDMVNELDDGNLIIIPANGRALGNRNFTQPGPERHMLVVKGYDRKKAQFITNEPGIRQGESWRYDRDVLFNAIRDYATGYHAPIPPVSKVMIVVKR